MQTFTGWQYLLIDVANQWGLDKETYDVRLEWAEANLDKFEELAKDREWKEKPLYLKAVMAVRKALKGEPSGHMVGFDAVCSGMQIMSALTGCKAGAEATGLIHQDVRSDAYKMCLDIMRRFIPSLPDAERKKIKDAVMTGLYGSIERPVALFGEGTPELNAYYKALTILCPGACELLEDLRKTWVPFAKVHEWIMPDGFHVRNRVLDKVEKRIEIDELNHATFSYEYYENIGKPKGVANIANVTHSFDAYIVRSIERRCNYDDQLVDLAVRSIEECLMSRSIPEFDNEEAVAFIGYPDPKLLYFYEQYQRSSVVDVAILPYIDQTSVYHLPSSYLRKLAKLLNGMLEYKPFPVVTVHDEFKCHPNNMNHLRKQYNNILADLAESNVLDDILSQLFKVKGQYQKLSDDLGDYIRESNYAIN